MALVAGDLVIPAGSFNGEAGVADLTVGTLCPEGLLLGIFDGTAGDEEYIWNNGQNSGAAATNPNNCRKCTPYSGATSYLGKTVQLNGVSPAFQGVVIQELDTELDNVNGDGTQVPILVIKTSQFVYVAEPANVTEV